MELSIILTTTLITTTPDLCAYVYVDENGQPYTDAIGQTWSRFCDRTGPSAPVLDHDVCCTLSGDNARCALPDRKGRCSTGSARYYCEHGEATSSGAVVCYQPLPSICDFGFCGSVLPPGGGPLEDDICCFSDGSCIEIETVNDMKACAVNDAYMGYCENGAQNADGTVECFDE